MEDSLYQCLSRVLAHLLNLLAAASRAHGAGIAIVVFFLFELNVWAVTWYYDGATGLPATKTRARVQRGIGFCMVVFAD